jgi:branched-chain amino acid transport system substrate-binding protein
MLRIRLAVLGCLLGVFALGVSACGSDDDGGGGGGGSSEVVQGNSLTIYSSLPLQGTSKGQSEAVISGEKLALKEAGSKVGKFNIKYVSLDDSTAQNPGTADEGQTAQNARKAVQDKTTIFYLGSSTPVGRRSRCRSSTRPASRRSRPRTPTSA